MFRLRESFCSCSVAAVGLVRHIAKMTDKSSRQPPELPEIIDEPGMAERFQRGLQRALNTPPQHRTKPTPKPKERPASKRKGNAR